MKITEKNNNCQINTANKTIFSNTYFPHTQKSQKDTVLKKKRNKNVES